MTNNARNQIRANSRKIDRDRIADINKIGIEQRKFVPDGDHFCVTCNKKVREIHKKDFASHKVIKK